MSLEQSEPYLTPEDFRNRLFHKLKHKGHFDSVKAQLRNIIVHELQQGSGVQHVPQPDSEEDSLLFKAANSLVANHLQRCQYEYTHSVFMPECGLPQNQVLSLRDILKLLNIDPLSKLHKCLIDGISDSNKKGFLWVLLSEIAALQNNVNSEKVVQTEPNFSHDAVSLEEKLGRLEKQYKSAYEQNQYGSRVAVEERVLSYQKQLEERAKTEIKLENARYKENELARMKIEERERCRNELERSRRELENTYQMKVQALSEREKHMLDRLQKLQETQEKEIYAQRQTILSELERIKLRENTSRRDEEVNEREQRLRDDKYNTMEQNLRRRELEIEQREHAYNQKLKAEMDRFALDEEAKYVQRIKELEIREAKNAEDTKFINAEKEALKTLRDDLRAKTQKVNELEMVDYKFVKEENAVMRNELESVRNRLAEIQSELERERSKHDDLLREVADSAKRPSHDMLVLQRELERARDNLKSDLAICEHQKQKLEQQLREEMEQNTHLIRKLEEKLLEHQQMSREILDLKQQLNQTNHALNGHVVRAEAMKKTDETESSDDLSLGGPDDFSISITQRTPRSRHKGSKARDNDSEDDEVRETRRRLQALEQEAEVLDNNYRAFHARMTNVEIGWPLEASRANQYKFPSTYTMSTFNRSQETTPTRSNPNSPPKTKPRSTVHKNRASSSPNKQETDGPHDESHNLPSFGISSLTVKSSSQEDAHSKSSILPRQDLRVSDLDAGPGEPSIVVVPGSNTVIKSDQSNNKPAVSLDDAWKTPVKKDEDESPIKEKSTLSLDDTWKSSPKGDVVSETPPSKGSALPSITKPPSSLPPMSLDNMWKQSASGGVSFDAGWKDKKQEQNKIEQTKVEKPKSPEPEQKSSPSKSSPSKEPTSSEPSNNNEPQIDPMMQKYMAMVQKQKEEEKIKPKPVAQESKDEIHSIDDGSPIEDPNSIEGADSDGFQW